MDEKQSLVSEPADKSPISLLGALIIAVTIAFFMVLTTTIIFLKSSAYATVQQIQVGSKLANSKEFLEVDNKNPIKANDIDEYALKIKSKILVIDDNADFGQDAVSDKSLGL